MLEPISNSLAALILTQLRSLLKRQLLPLRTQLGGYAAICSSRNLLRLPNWLHQPLSKELNRLDYWHRRLAEYRRQGIQILTSDCPEYPVLLKEISDFPAFLFVKGSLTLLNLPLVAVVGSRKVTSPGVRHTKKFSRELAQKGLGIVSGLAEGVDTCAHRGALEVGGKTIAVLGSGLNQLYPQSNAALAEEILATGGTLISEYAPEQKPKPFLFPQRNRIISGLCVGVLVVEASPRSGSLITARLAAEQGREVFAIPGSINNFFSRGCHQLIRNGATLVEEPKHILEQLQQLLQCQYNAILDLIEAEKVGDLEASAQPDLNPQQKKLYKLMSQDPETIDELVAATEMSCSQLSVLLIELELLGLITHTAYGYQRL